MAFNISIDYLIHSRILYIELEDVDFNISGCIGIDPNAIYSQFHTADAGVLRQYSSSGNT